MPPYEVEGHNSGGHFCCILGAPGRQTTPANPFSKTSEYFNFGGEKTNKHKQLGGIVPEMGGGQIVYVFPLFLGKRETHKQNSQEISGKGRGESRDSPGIIPGQSRENFVYVFACLLVFSLPY